MIDRLFGIKFHDRFQVFALLVIAVGLPWTKILMSLGVMFLLLNVLLEAKYSELWKNWKMNRSMYILVALLLLQVLSMFWSEDLNYALWDFRVKLPMYVIPVVLMGRPLYDKQSIKIVLYGFLLSLLVTSIVNFGSYHQFFGERTILGIRDLSLFESHIRYGLCMVMGIAVLLVWLYQRQIHVVLGLIVVIWFIYYTWFSQVVSAVIALLAVIFLLSFLLIWTKNKIISAIVLVAPILLAVKVIQLIQPAERVQLDPKKLPVYTPSGNLYVHYMHEFSVENGLPVFAYYCENELDVTWKTRSEIPYTGKDRRGQLLYATLCRYLTSLNLTKDRNGVLALTEQDVRNIEDGHASRAEAKGGMYARLLAVRYELTYSSDPNEHSLLQRLAYWKAARHIIMDNWLFGVGVGDVQRAFDVEYMRSNSLLTKENRLRAHNQFLTYTISFGIGGFFIFSALLFSRLRSSFMEKEVLTLVFISIFVLSCLVEDTLETQAGVTFFGLFFALFRNKKLAPTIYDEHQLQS